MTWKTILIILSLICFLMATFGWDAPWAINLIAAGLFLFVATFINISASTERT